MTRLHHPVSIPGLLGTAQSAGFPLVLDSEGNVDLASTALVDFDEVMKWQGVWTGGAYEAGDVVTDGGYLMVANKDTTDRPAPQPAGPPEDGVSPTPTWDTLSPTVTYLGTGTRFVFTEGGWVNSWRVWIPTVSANNIYVATMYDRTDPAHIVEQSISITPTETGWYEVLVTPTVVLPGDDLLLVLYAQNNAGFAPHDGPWDYTGQSQPVADPGVGNFNRNNGGTIVRINSTDQNALDRDGELAEIVPGVELNVEDGEWIVRVNSSTDMGGWWEFTVTTQSGGLPNNADGVKIVAWEIANPQPTDYVKSDLYWDTNQPTFATASGVFTDEPITGAFIDTPLQTYIEPQVAAVEDNTGYGADVNFTEASVSPDWDIMATSEGGASSGGIPEAPVDGAQYARQDADWSQLAGGNNTLAGLFDTDLETNPPEVSDLLVYQGVVDTALDRGSWVTSAYRTRFGVPDNSIDGSIGTEWVAENSGDEPYIQWDLGEPISVDSFRFISAASPYGAVSPMTIRYSNDDTLLGASWGTGAVFNTGYGVDTGVLDIAPLPPVTARYWRLYGLNWGLSEFYLYKTVASWAPVGSEWVAPTLLNGWSDLSPTFQSARYRKDPDGVVQIQGVLAGGTTTVGTDLFTLPVGFRPEAVIIVPTLTFDNAISRIDVLANGVVEIAAVASATWLNISCSFAVD